MLTSKSRWLWLPAVLFLITGIACSPQIDPLLDMLDTQLSNAKVDSLTRTMNFVVSPERFQKAQFEEKLAASLNRWAQSESELMSQDWKLDPLAQQVVEKYNLPTTEEIDGLGFVNTDSYFLQQSYWAKQLAERIVAIRDLGPFEVARIAAGVEVQDVEDDVDPLGVALQKVHENMSLDDAETLAKSLKAFDWVVRNISLLKDDELVNSENDAENFRLNDSDSFPAAGIPGLGYTRFPAQTMLTSRGDFVDRAKLFMTMLDQLEISSVMLGVRTPDSEEYRPWAVGVSVGGELYLFDTKLGLPIPNNKPATIATLSELKADPQLLKSLDLSVNESLKDDTKYWTTNEQLNDLKGLIYCSPESLTRRCWELENKLVGQARMKLYLEPFKIIEQMPKVDGLEYEIWDIDFKTHQLRLALSGAISNASFKDDIRDKITWYYTDELYIDEFVQYRTARSKYFNGLFETIRNDGNLNAVELFYSMIYKDSKIDSLASDQLFQRRLSISQGQMSSDEFQRMIQGVQANMRLVRRDSGFFLSCCHFEFGNYSTAANWLTRLETIEDTKRWQDAINYLRARSLEAQRNYAAAIEIYERQDSIHFHGDLIRVRQLKKLLGDSYVSAKSNDGEQEEVDDAEMSGSEGSSTKVDADAEKSEAEGSSTKDDADSEKSEAEGSPTKDDAGSEKSEADGSSTKDDADSEKSEAEGSSTKDDADAENVDDDSTESSDDADDGKESEDN